MPRIIYTQEQKTEIIKKAKEIGAAAAAKAEGVSYPTVLKWMKENGASAAEKVKNLPGDSVAVLDTQIKSVESDIDKLCGEIAEKKEELKALRKAKEKAEKVEKAAAEAAQKKAIIDAVLKSGLSLEEVVARLQE